MTSTNLLTLVVLFAFVRPSFNSVPLIELCDGSFDYQLSSTGYDSSLRVLFGNPFDSDDDDEFKATRRPLVVREPCKLKITAPATHIVSVSFAKISGVDGARSSKGKSTTVDASKPNTNVSCMISIYLPENRRTAVWKVDPCQDGDMLPPARLLTPQLRILWNPPPANETPELLSRIQLVLTAVGRDETCLSPGQHLCLKNGFLSWMCVANELLCDGIVHCPRDISDEDSALCADRAPPLIQNSNVNWETFANELLKKFATHHRSNNVPIGPMDNNIFIHRHMISSPSTTTTRSPFSSNSDVRTDLPHDDDGNVVNDDVQDAFAHYGPWGYLMLGMLICGTVLMVCGFWECCCRKSKPSTHNTTRRTMMNGVTRDLNATVLVLTNERDPVPPRSPPTAQDSAPPPAYDDLDRPPSYCTLFPNLKGDDRVALDSYVVVPDERVSFEVDTLSVNHELSRDSTHVVYAETEMRNTSGDDVDERTQNETESPIVRTTADNGETSVILQEPVDSHNDTDEDTDRTAINKSTRAEAAEPSNREQSDDDDDDYENKSQQRPVIVLTGATEESSTS